MGETLLASRKLRLNSNPFDASDSNRRLGRPLQRALGEVIRHIGLETPVVVVPGSPGTGKTLLAKMAERVCADMGLSARRIHRGDLVDVADRQRSDVLLVDEADSVSVSTLQRLLFGGEKRPATTTVLLCLPASTPRLSTAGNVAVVELSRLSQSDTRHYLQERATHAGLLDLFVPAAFELIVDGSRGVPRSLWSIASLAYFYAATAGASRVSREHVVHALASQIPPPELGPIPFAPAAQPVTETPVGNDAPSVANPPRNSANVAVFKHAQHPASQMPTPKAQEAQRPSISSAITSAELLEIIAAASEPSDTPGVELPTDGYTAAPPGSAQPKVMGVARNNAGTRGGLTRWPSVIVGSAVGVAGVLAAAVALGIFLQPETMNQKTVVATGVENVSITEVPAVVNQPVATPENALSAAGRAAQTASNRTTRLPNRSAAIPPLTVSKSAAVRTSQPSTSGGRALRSAVPSRVPPQNSLLAPVENRDLTTASVPVIAAAKIGNLTSSAEAASVGARTAQQRVQREGRANQARALESGCLIGRILCIGRENGNSSGLERPASSLAAKDESARRITQYFDRSRMSLTSVRR